MMMINTIVKAWRLLPQKMTYRFSQWDWQYIPKPYNTKDTKQQKLLLRGKDMRPYPRYVGNLFDTLNIYGAKGNKLYSLYQQFLQNKQTPLSSQFVALLLYNFSKQNLLNEHTWIRIQPYISRNRGQYSARSIFGCLYCCIKFGKLNYMEFFVQEMSGQKLTFSESEAIEIIQAYNSSVIPFTTEQKHQFWETYFKNVFDRRIKEGVKMHKILDVFRLFDALYKFQYFQDEDLWNIVIHSMEKKRGWIRTEIIERLYPLTGTFPKAKEIFDEYYYQLSINPHIKWRYNLQQLRLYTSEEMIMKSQDNIQMIPADRTLFKRKDAAKFNQEHRQWLMNGAKQLEAEVVKDKAQSLAYVIKDRYDAMKNEGFDFSQITEQEFTALFGEYNKELMYQEDEEQDLKIEKR